MKSLNEDQLVSIEIDFEELKKNRLNEDFLTMFGGIIKILLDGMFGGGYVPATIGGKRGDLFSFARTIGREKQYLDAAKTHGLDDPRTYENKRKLELAAKNFKATTGIPWPFK